MLDSLHSFTFVYRYLAEAQNHSSCSFYCLHRNFLIFPLARNHKCPRIMFSQQFNALRDDFIFKSGFFLTLHWCEKYFLISILPPVSCLYCLSIYFCLSRCNKSHKITKWCSLVLWIMCLLQWLILSISPSLSLAHSMQSLLCWW
jgi:hypothetical protein